MRFEVKMLAYCGLYCEQCSCRAAFVEQDSRHLEQLPGKYRGKRTLAECDCEGCKGRSICGDCGIRDCAAAKELVSCGDCGDFPCELLSRFGNDGIPHHHQALENLRSIRANGYQAWFENLQPALHCHCGQRQSWYFRCPDHQVETKS